MGSGVAPLSQRGRVWSGRGWDGAETSAPLSPHPRSRAHARMPSRSLGGPGSPSGPRARADACWSGVGSVRGAGRRQQAGVRSGVMRLKYSTPPDERCGPLARPAGRSEREAKCKALRAPGANRFSLRTYQPEGARSCLLSEVKQGRARLVSWMGDHLGIPDARGFLPARRGPLAPPPPTSRVPILGSPPQPQPLPGRGEWVARALAPAADLGCLHAAREPLRIRIRLPGHQTTGSPFSIWGSFGLPQAIPGLAPTPARAPSPTPPPA